MKSISPRKKKALKAVLKWLADYGAELAVVLWHIHKMQCVGEFDYFEFSITFALIKLLKALAVKIFQRPQPNK